jgi:hypothetical protein
MIPTVRQIELMDKILVCCIDRSNKRIRDASDIVKKLNISEEEAKNALKLVCEFGKDEKFIKSYITGYGNYIIGEVDQIYLDNFLKQGGFNGYYNTQNS